MNNDTLTSKKTATVQIPRTYWGHEAFSSYTPMMLRCWALPSNHKSFDCCTPPPINLDLQILLASQYLHLFLHLLFTSLGFSPKPYKHHRIYKYTPNWSSRVHVVSSQSFLVSSRLSESVMNCMFKSFPLLQIHAEASPVWWLLTGNKACEEVTKVTWGHKSRALIPKDWCP